MMEFYSAIKNKFWKFENKSESRKCNINWGGPNLER